MTVRLQKNSQKLKQFQERDMPINYSNTIVNADGKIEERKGKLNERIVSGYGVIWGSKNDYGEKFVKGCCSKSITEQGPGSNAAYQIKFRDRHGKSCSLFASIVEDEIGLYFETKPLDKVPWCDELLVQLKSGTINNFSIGFKHCWDRVEWDDEDSSMINLEIRLFEISAVDIPSDTATYATRSADDNAYLMDDVEDFIYKLPRPLQLEARTIFTRCMLPLDETPLEQRQIAPEVKTPAEESTGIANYLLKKLN